MITVNGNTVTVSTRTLDAVLEGGALVSLRNREGREYLPGAKADSPALDIVFRGSDARAVKGCPHGSVTCTSLSDTCAEIRFDALDGNGVLTLTEDEETGDLCVEPEVSSARYGVLAARWTISGFGEDMKLTAPLFQGVDMDPADELIRGRRWIWPHRWEAGLAILHDSEGGFWVHCRDTAYRAKALLTGGDRSLSFDAEAWGPIDRSLSAGGLVWRINVFRGGWDVPAGIYRDWLWEAYGLERDERRRPGWQKDIRLALSWAPADRDLLTALSKKVDPKTVLLHVPHWRTHPYDQYYPDFTPSEKFRDFLRYANSMGFHVMPHANSVDMDPSHIHRAGENPAVALPAVLSAMKHIHIRDCKGDGPSPGAPADQACGRGDIDLVGYFKAMVDQKYDGPVCLEVIGPDQNITDATRIAAESYGYMNAILKQLGAR